MAVEDDEMRLEFLQDWGVSDATFRDVSAGSNSTISAMLKREYYEETAGDATVQIVVFSEIDAAVRNAQSFAITVDYTTT